MKNYTQKTDLFTFLFKSQPLTLFEHNQGIIAVEHGFSLLFPYFRSSLVLAPVPLFPASWRPIQTIQEVVMFFQHFQYKNRRQMVEVTGIEPAAF